MKIPFEGDNAKDGNRQHLDLSWIVLLLIFDDLTEVMLIIDNLSRKLIMFMIDDPTYYGDQPTSQQSRGSR